MLSDLILSVVHEFESWARGVASKQLCFLLAILVVLPLTMVGCAREAQAPQEDTKMTLLLSSTAFQEGGAIPTKYTCDG